MKNVVEGDLQIHQLKPLDINTVVPELHARSFFGKIFRGVKKATGAVGKVIGTARKVVGTVSNVFNTAKNMAGPAGKLSAQFPNFSVGLF